VILFLKLFYVVFANVQEEYSCMTVIESAILVILGEKCKLNKGRNC